MLLSAGEPTRPLPAMSSENELIERTYRAYFTVFQTGNVRAITPYYEIPAMFLTPSGTRVLASVQDAEQYLERMIYGSRTRGYVRGVLTAVQVKQLAEDLALLGARSERFAREGELLERVSVVCTMRKSDGTWRIATTALCDPERAFELR